MRLRFGSKEEVAKHSLAFSVDELDFYPGIRIQPVTAAPETDPIAFSHRRREVTYRIGAHPGYRIIVAA